MTPRGRVQTNTLANRAGTRRHARAPFARLAISTAFAVAFLSGCYRVSIAGDLRADRSPAGDWVLRAKDCRPVRHDELGAADFVAVGADGLRIGVSVDNAHWRAPATVSLVNLTDPAGVKVRLQQDGVVCRTVDAVSQEPVAADDPYYSSGHLVVDCVFPKGGTIRGSLVFKHCGL